MSGEAWDLYVPLVKGIVGLFVPLMAVLLGVNYLERAARSSSGDSEGWD